ncbi:hypothetical protein [Virgibacillus salexigens]|uniref:hypothetical protein n=1 Tax=Virgibacillus salexigens TaxID=61016 RepID=UPI0030820117
MPKFVVREVKEIIKEFEITANNAEHAIKIFNRPSSEDKNYEGDFGSIETHITAKRKVNE